MGFLVLPAVLEMRTSSHPPMTTISMVVFFDLRETPEALEFWDYLPVAYELNDLWDFLASMGFSLVPSYYF